MLELCPTPIVATLAQLPTSQPAEQARQWFETLRSLAGRVPANVWIGIVCVVVGWVVLKRVWSAVWRQIRLSRPARIHPSLARYNVDRVELQRRQRELAGGIVATSTSNRLAGYRLVRQVEAVFVEGFSTPDEAVIALKATAVERGANAILNVTTQHTAAGRCTASGDAVLVSPVNIAPTRVSNPNPPAIPPKLE